MRRTSIPSDTGNVVLGVDLDGVCADFYGRMREIAAEWFERKSKDLTKDVTFGLKERGIESPEQHQSLHRFAVTQRDLFKTEAMILGACKYLRKPSDEGYRIRIMTHRLLITTFMGRRCNRQSNGSIIMVFRIGTLFHEGKRPSRRGYLH
jgi:hypothetical protein